MAKSKEQSHKQTMGSILVKLRDKNKPTELQKQLKKSENDLLEDLFFDQLKSARIKMDRQFKSNEDRDWRWDFADPNIKLVIDIDGGEWKYPSGHTTGTGINKDRHKDWGAFLNGYKPMRFTGSMVKDKTAIEYVKKLYFGNK